MGMVLDYFLPQQNFSIKQLEELTGFVKGKGAWEMAEILSYQSLGLQVKAITNTSYRKFAERGFEYLVEVDGPQVAEWSKEHTGDLMLEQKRAKKVAEKGLAERRVPSREDIKRCLDQDQLVLLAVNAKRLNGKSGFFGHRVLIYSADDTGVIMHDPGLPQKPSRNVDWDLLEAAWADPSKDAKLLISVGK